MPLRAALAHHVIVDLETTGLDARVDEVVELGALFVENGVPVRSFSRLFQPQQPLPPIVFQLTGLLDEDLAGLGRFTDYLPQLERELDGWTVIAHNARFEQSFLRESFERIDAPLLDSCELLHYLYPELASHSLDAVVPWAGAGERTTHRALKDCEDTFAVLSHALRQCVHDRRADDVAELVDILQGSGPDAAPLVSLLEALERSCRASRSSALRHRRPTPPVSPLESVQQEGLSPMLRFARASPPPGLSGASSFSSGKALASSTPRGATHAASTAAVRSGDPALVDPRSMTGASSGRPVPSGPAVASVVPGSETSVSSVPGAGTPAASRWGSGENALAAARPFRRVDRRRDSALSPRYACPERTHELTRVMPQMDYQERAPRAYLRAFVRRSEGADLEQLSHWFKQHYPVLVTLAGAAATPHPSSPSPTPP